MDTIDEVIGEALSYDNDIKGIVPKIDKTSVFIIIKEHKTNFPKKIKCRLPNPFQSHFDWVKKTFTRPYK